MLCYSVKFRHKKKNFESSLLFRQSRSTMATQDIGETINATNVMEGVSPQWNEMIYADILEDSNHTEGKEKSIFVLFEKSIEYVYRGYYFDYR